MSLGESRVFVNSGVSRYGISDERLRQRGTSAHNTVKINGLNSSEVWSGFRVARRADIVNRLVSGASDAKSVKFSAGHNGYKKLGMNCIHYREWDISLMGCTVTDVLKGGFNSAIAYLHLHPDVDVVSSSKRECVLSVKGYEVRLDVTGANIVVENSTWHPEFGISVESQRIRLQYLQSRVCYHISWQTL